MGDLRLRRTRYRRRPRSGHRYNDKQKQIEDLELETNKNLKIQEKANELLDSYKNQLDPRIYQLAKENVDKTTAEKTPELVAASTPDAASADGTTKRKVVRRKREEDEG